MRVERITPENALGKGWARLRFNDCAAPSELATMAIVRPRHTAPFLGQAGWQIAECRLPLNIELISASEFELLLPPAVVQHLEVASNYEICFFNSNLHRIISVVVRWSGVSYRAPRGEISPIEIVKPADLSLDQVAVGNSIKQEDFDKSLQPAVSGEDASTKGLASAWGGITNSDNTLNQPKSLEETEDFPFPRAAQPISNPSEYVPIGSYDRKMVRRVRCRNPVCGAQILNSMKICPFCSTSI
jgi:hypothetical protein